MTGPRRHRHAGAAVGAAVVGLLLVALFTHGGRGAGDPAGRPETAHRTAAATAELDRSTPGRTADGPSLPDLTPWLPAAPVLLSAGLALVGLVAVGAPRSPASRPLPVRSGRGPPTARR